MFGRIGVPEIVVLLMIAGLGVVYFLPTIVAMRRRKANTTPIVLVNVLLGWSVIGWIVAMVWALSTQLVDGAAPPSLCPHCGKYSERRGSFCQLCGKSFALPAISAGR